MFLTIHLVPGDPARIMLGERAREESLTELRHQLGLDRPFLVQYGLYLRDLARGDLGRSIKTRELVLVELIQRFPATVELTLVAMFFAVVLGIGLGLVAAIRAGGPVDTASMGIAVCGVSMPIFWLGILLMLVFSYLIPTTLRGWQETLPWLPTLQFPPSGRLSPTLEGDFRTSFYLLESVLRLEPRLAWDALRHLILPAAALATIPLAIIARMTRACVLEVLRQDYIRVARAKGLSERVVLMKHALRNALLPIITVVALQVGYLLGGAIITERIFAWPGIGSYLLRAVEARDFRAVQGGVLLVATCFMLVNLLADMLYVVFNPRLRGT